ncbi:hypothetical protein ABIC08_007712 [Bradyrhizobium sp. RT9b]|uniref:hypothetical protein n=1 Tax=unclassified Bradyrhizobium TaxID=2631580 RepID=UPI003399E945
MNQIFVGETFSMISTAVAPEILERLLERLQSGWRPRSDEIDMRVPQFEFARWTFLPDPTGRNMRLSGRLVGSDFEGSTTLLV